MYFTVKIECIIDAKREFVKEWTVLFDEKAKLKYMPCGRVIKDAIKNHIGRRR